MPITASQKGLIQEQAKHKPLDGAVLLVDNRGYPVFSLVYKGNTSETKTLPEVLDKLEVDCKGTLFSSKPNIVVDKGIATEENIALLE